MRRYKFVSLTEFCLMIYIMCYKGGETHFCLFIHCEMTQKLQIRLINWFGLSWVSPPTVESFMRLCFLGWGKEVVKPLVQLNLFSGSLSIWLERSSKIFQDHYLSFHELCEKITFLATLQAKAHENYSDLVISELHQN